MSMKGIAKETLTILDRGSYLAPSGKTVDIKDAVESAIDGTALYEPGQLEKLLADGSPTGDAGGALTIEVTDEKSGAAARRLYEADPNAQFALLNFASARNPGGGFLNGSKAQEEDLARCSALYRCLVTQLDYYERNRAEPSVLYTDHLIYSPEVPFIRAENLDLLEEPFTAAVLTAPAPNAGQYQGRDEFEEGKLEEVLKRRAGYVLAALEYEGHTNLILGAWGCGVFCNDPVLVAEVFRDWLQSDRFSGSFTRVVFPVFDRSKGRVVNAAFRQTFEG